MNPIDYRGGGLANYTITDKPFEEAHGQKNVLIVGTDEQIPDDQSIIFEVKYPDGNVAFQVVQQ